MRNIHQVVVIILSCACTTLTCAADGDWTTIYGSAREEARQISSSSLAVPLSPHQWNATEAQRREM